MAGCPRRSRTARSGRGCRLVEQLAEPGVDDGSAAGRQVDLLEEREVAGLPDLDPVEAGADLVPFALPLLGAAGQEIVDPDRGFGDVALDPNAGGAGAQRVRAPGHRGCAPKERKGDQRAKPTEQMNEALESGHGVFTVSEAAGARRRARSLMTAPEACTSLKLIIASASRERAAATSAGPERVRARISAWPPPTLTRSAAETAPTDRTLLSSAGTAAGSTTSASMVRSGRSAVGATAAVSAEAISAARVLASRPRQSVRPASTASANARVVPVRSGSETPVNRATARQAVETRPVPRRAPSSIVSAVTVAAADGV